MEYVIRNDGGSKRTVKISDAAAEEKWYLEDRNRGERYRSDTIIEVENAMVKRRKASQRRKIVTEFHYELKKITENYLIKRCKMCTIVETYL